MNENILFGNLNVFTITPLIFASLLALLLETGVWKREIILSLFMVIYAICSTLVLYGKMELAFVISDVSSVTVVLYALFRQRS
jgi:hypothetical protein